MDIIPFESANNLPATIASLFGDGTANELAAPAAGFPVVSIKGKVFHVVRGGERQLLTMPGDADTPASYIDVVIVRANPHRSKVFYAAGYTEGADDKPTCYSNDGTAPASVAKEPQSAKCATCVHNQWGSRITENGSKGRACSDSRRLAIAPVTAPDDVMLLRVPAASIKALEEYGRLLATRGVRPEVVVTRVQFDYSVAHPKLLFKPTGIITDVEKLQSIKVVRESELARTITGELAGVLNEDEAAAPLAEEVKPVTVQPPVPTPVAKPVAAKPAVAKPAATAAPAEPATEPVPKPAAKTAGASSNLKDQLADLLGDIGFDA